MEFIIDCGGVMDIYYTGFMSPFSDCTVEDANITEIDGASMYSVEITLNICSVDTLVNGNYTGFATSRSDVSSDDILVVAVSNDGYAGCGEYVQD
jgi:hypothetical protein